MERPAGFGFKWGQCLESGVTYRRRDVDDDGGGDNDRGVWFEVSHPVRKAKKNPASLPTGSPR